MKKIYLDDEVQSFISTNTIQKLVGSGNVFAISPFQVQNDFNALTKYKPDFLVVEVSLPKTLPEDFPDTLPAILFKLGFVTHTDKFEIKAFELCIKDYKLKAIDEGFLVDRIGDSESLTTEDESKFYKFIAKQSQQEKKIVLHTDKKIHIVDISTIIRCEAHSGYTRFHLTEDRTIFVAKSLLNFEKILTHYDFIRTHQSHLININFIDYYDRSDGGSIVMKDHARIPLARRHKAHFKSVLQAL